MEKIIRIILWKFKPKKVKLVYTAGRLCPKCGSFGLFDYSDKIRCEECLSELIKLTGKK